MDCCEFLTSILTSLRLDMSLKSVYRAYQIGLGKQTRMTFTAPRRYGVGHGRQSLVCVLTIAITSQQNLAYDIDTRVVVKTFIKTLNIHEPLF
jgi:hypothetical protein